MTHVEESKIFLHLDKNSVFMKHSSVGVSTKVKSKLEQKTAFCLLNNLMFRHLVWDYFNKHQKLFCSGKTKFALEAENSFL